MEEVPPHAQPSRLACLSVCELWYVVNFLVAPATAEEARAASGLALSGMRVYIVRALQCIVHSGGGAGLPFDTADRRRSRSCRKMNDIRRPGCNTIPYRSSHAPPQSYEVSLCTYLMTMQGVMDGALQSVEA